jgi:hypothetical protein
MMVEVANAAELERILRVLRDTLAEHGERRDAQVMHDLMRDWQDAKTKDARGQVAHRITASFSGAGSWSDRYLPEGASVEAQDAFQKALESLYTLARSFR